MTDPIRFQDWCGDRHKALMENLHLRDRNIHTRLNGMDAALQERTKEMERRLEGLNQLREDVVKDRDLFVRSGEYKIGHKNIEDAIWDLRKAVTSINLQITQLETRYESRITLATVVSIMSALFALAGVITPWLLNKP